MIPKLSLPQSGFQKKHDLNITAFTVRIHKDKEQLFLEVDQKYPLPELSESYESRRKNKPGNKLSSEITWEQIIPKLEYSFAEKGIAICRKLRGEGNPSLRRFGNIVVNQDGFSWISLNFRVKYINVYAGTDDKQSSIQKLKDIFGDAVDVSEWRDGVSFSISTENDFNKLIKWMKLG
jgi:hypothetical protein